MVSPVNKVQQSTSIPALLGLKMAWKFLLLTLVRGRPPCKHSININSHSFNQTKVVNTKFNFWKLSDESAGIITALINLPVPANPTLLNRGMNSVVHKKRI